jgi:hypothetical protein
MMNKMIKKLATIVNYAEEINLKIKLSRKRALTLCLIFLQLGTGIESDQI